MRRQSDIEWTAWVQRHAELIARAGLPGLCFSSRDVWDHFLSHGWTTAGRIPPDGKAPTYDSSKDAGLSKDAGRQWALTELIKISYGDPPEKEHAETWHRSLRESIVRCVGVDEFL